MYAKDVDLDNDIDILIRAQDEQNIIWYENNGKESFISHDITRKTNPQYLFSTILFVLLAS